MVAGDFLTLAEAKAHLRVTICDEDDLILLYLQMAQNLVIDRIERATTDTVVLGEIGEWDRETVPDGVRAAVLIQLGELFAFRGDDPVVPHIQPDAHGRLSPRVEGFLGPWRDLPVA